MFGIVSATREWKIDLVEATVQITQTEDSFACSNRLRTAD